LNVPRRRAIATALAAAALSGVLLGLYSRVAAPWFALGWVVFVPWLADVDRATSLRGALGRGIAMSLAFALAVFPWFAAALSRYSGAPAPLTLALLLLAAPLLQAQTTALALSRWWLRRRGAAWLLVVFAGGAAYVGCEWITGKLLGDTLGQGLYASPWLRQAADLAGARGLTFILVTANGALLEAGRALRSRRGPLGGPAALVAASVAALSVYGAWRCATLSSPEPGEVPLRAGVVQANLANYERLGREMGTYDAVQMILNDHIELSSELAAQRPDVLVWPETVYPTTFGAPKSEAGAELDARIREFAARVDKPIIFGSYDSADGREYNAAVFLDVAGGFRSYRKARLFPLTEWVPRWLDSRWLRDHLPWLGTWKPGRGANVVGVALGRNREVKIAPLICYDAVESAPALAAVRRGAEVIVTLSNDSWFADSAGARLHFVVSAFRSIETRRPQIRATNTGISAVFDRLGESVVSTRVDERTAFVAAVVPRRGPATLMVRWGDWFGPFAAVLGVLLCALPIAKNRAAGAGSRPVAVDVRRARVEYRRIYLQRWATPGRIGCGLQRSLARIPNRGTGELFMQGRGRVAGALRTSRLRRMII